MRAGPARARAGRRRYRGALLRHRRTPQTHPWTMNFSLRYLTEYDYDKSVSDNLNVLRVRPATTSTQRCDEFSVRVDPEARVSRHIDYFGTEVIEFGLAKPHDHLTIDVRARVVTTDPPEAPGQTWGDLAADHYRQVGGEFLLPTGDEPEEAEEIDELDARLAEAESPLAAAH